MPEAPAVELRWGEWHLKWIQYCGSNHNCLAMPEICASSLLQDDFISAIPSAPLLMKVCKKLALSRPLQNPFGPGNLLLRALER